jgi:hypothetical protein
MKLNQLIAAPQLTKVSLDDEDVIKEFGEPLEWWIWDRQPLDRFLKLASAEGNTGDQIVATMREMILDEEGNPLLVGDATLPTTVLVKVMNKMVSLLGK